MLDDLARETFVRQLNTQFQVETHGGSLALELVEASDARSAPGYEAFSLVFRGPGDAFLRQAMYHFHHAAIGAFELFIVPIRQDAHSLYYEAVFNRPLKESQA
jgi:hypothetical protein